MNKKVARNLIIAALAVVVLAFLLPGDCRNAYRHPEKDDPGEQGHAPAAPAPAAPANSGTAEP